MPLRRPKSNKNPPIFSHEFVIQNHPDIVSCVAMVFIIGLMFQATSPVASLFVTLQHNETQMAPGEDGEMVETDLVLYTYGMKDCFSTFFYFLMTIILHAVIQEYILDKLNRRMHLSKIKHSKFNESGQLLVFYGISAAWGADIIMRENLVTNIASLWEGYPHDLLPFIVKFFFIIQAAYWLHGFPELYFQKIKKEEIPARIQYTVLYLLFIIAAYVLNFSRIGLCLLVLHCSVEFLFHLSRLLYFSEKTEIANSGFMIWNVFFVLVRLGSITLAVLTFWYGLVQVEKSNPGPGDFNTFIVRINCLAAVCLLQAWMMWNFITFHLKRMRERSQAVISGKKYHTNSLKKKDKRSKGDDENEVSYVDSSTGTENGTIRPRTPKSKKQ